jgi:hypothetical protein
MTNTGYQTDFLGGWSASRCYLETGFWEAPNPVFKQTNKSQPAVVESQTYDRIAFASCPSVKPDCARAFWRKAGMVPPSPTSSPFSAVRFEDEILRNTGIILVFRRRASGNSLQIRLAWRRKKDSNPRYRSERCKSRRLRKLRGIRRFRNSPGLPAPHSARQTAQLREASRGEALAIVWLKVVTRKPVGWPNWFRT